MPSASSTLQSVHMARDEFTDHPHDMVARKRGLRNRRIQKPPPPGDRSNFASSRHQKQSAFDCGTHPGVVADQLLALVARVGEEAVVARDAVGAVVRLDVLAAVQGLFAVVAVEAVGHGGTCPGCRPERREGGGDGKWCSEVPTTPEDLAYRRDTTEAGNVAE